MTKMEKMAIRIMEILKEEHADIDVHIYYDNKRMSNKRIEKDVLVKDYLEYYNRSNPKAIAMTFEGTLYHDINYGSNKIFKRLESLFNENGYYSEFGYAWSLSIYKQ